MLPRFGEPFTHRASSTGDRAADLTMTGSYARYRVLRADCAVRVPLQPRCRRASFGVVGEPAFTTTSTSIKRPPSWLSSRTLPLTADDHHALDHAVAQAVTEYVRLRDQSIVNDDNERVGFIVHELRNQLWAATIARARKPNSHQRCFAAMRVHYYFWARTGGPWVRSPARPLRGADPHSV